MINPIKKAAPAYLKDIKELLRNRKYRDLHDKFIVEGTKIVQDIIFTGGKIESILCSSSYFKSYPDQIESILLKRIELSAVSDSFFEKISILNSSQGILAVVKKPQYDKHILNNMTQGVILLLDNIQDPGNMGTLIRTSVAFNVNAILLYGKSVDVFNPKVVRASSGMLLNIPIFLSENNTLDTLKQNGFNIFAADNSMQNSLSIYDMQQNTDKNVIVFGSEGKGVSSEILDISDKIFFIPINKRVESLNVASACSISLFHFCGRKN